MRHTGSDKATVSDKVIRSANPLGAVTHRSRGRSGRVTLEEVARAAGVSTATVSRAFNEPDKVSGDIRERVYSTAKELNWIPNAAGKALASSRTHIAGAIIPTLDNEIFARQINAMQSIIAARGYTLFLGCANYDETETFRHVQAMLARGVEALSIVGETHSAALFETLSSRKLPYVLTYSYRAESPHCCVGFDNRQAFCEITNYLLRNGHRRFGVILQPLVGNDRAEARLVGIRQTLAAAGAELPEFCLKVGPSTLAFGAVSFRELMDGPADKRPTAIVCGNDNLALGALSAAQEMGLHAPCDFSITGFDDLAISSMLSPRLTTMKIDNYQIGVVAAEKLLWALSHRGQQPKSVELKPELIIRDTTGPAPISACTPIHQTS